VHQLKLVILTVGGVNKQVSVELIIHTSHADEKLHRNYYN